MNTYQSKFPRNINHQALVDNIKKGFYGSDLIADANAHDVSDKNYVWCYLENPFTTNAVISSMTCMMLFDPSTGDNVELGETIQPGTSLWLPGIIRIKLTSGKLILKRSKFDNTKRFDALTGIINLDL